MAQLLTGLIIVIIILLSAFMLANTVHEYQYNVQAQGILFSSDLMPPADYLAELRGKDSFLVAVSMQEKDPLNTLQSQALNLLSVILIYNDKKSMSLVKVFESSQLVYCQTNWGEELINERIEVEECQQVLNNLEGKVLIEVNFHNVGLKQTQVVLEQNKVSIFPRSAADIADAPYKTMSVVFPNTDEAINNVNDLTDRVLAQAIV